jgi:hypothetical protein
LTDCNSYDQRARRRADGESPDADPSEQCADRNRKKQEYLRRGIDHPLYGTHDDAPNQK